ncbi:MAG: AAA family ATPase [Chlorobium sp.]|nr:AAA family ATPase [Chlorobium sp.]
MNGTASRIGKIVIRDFRFFPGNETYTFELGNEGKNLLLFGENGSGKSSFFQGLRILLSESPPPRPFEAYRNLFYPGEEGTITIELTAGMPQDVTWAYGEPHPAESGVSTFFDLARRATFLDYKALLRTNLFHEDAECINLFPLLVETLLRDAELPDGQTVYQHWNALRTFLPKDATLFDDGEEHDAWPTSEEQVNESAKQFRDQLDDILNKSAGGDKSLVDRANALLSKFTIGLEITTVVGDLKVSDVSSDPLAKQHSFSGAEVRLIASYAGKEIEHPALFLNEARLTAVALALYLAAVQATTPRDDATNIPRLLVLDDVLIGLDLSNRLPILKILEQEFSDWQVILMTFDRVWYDLAKEYTENTKKWSYLTLRVLPTTSDKPGSPIVEPGTDLLNKADVHLQNGDLMASAVYIRAAFETRIKNVCRDKGVKVAYKPDPKDVKADQLWNEICDRQKSRKEKGQNNFLDPNLMQDVEKVRSSVLNRLSHSGPMSLTTTEVKDALDIIRKLQIHEFKKA